MRELKTKKERSIEEIQSLIAIVEYQRDRAKDLNYNFEREDKELQRQIDLLIWKKRSLNRSYQERQKTIKEAPGKIRHLISQMKDIKEGVKSLPSAVATEKKKVKTKIERLHSLQAQIKKLKKEIENDS